MAIDNGTYGSEAHKRRSHASAAFGGIERQFFSERWEGKLIRGDEIHILHTKYMLKARSNETKMFQIYSIMRQSL